MDERDNPYAPPGPPEAFLPPEEPVETPSDEASDEDEQPYPKLLLGLLLAGAVLIAILFAALSLRDFLAGLSR